MVQSRRSWTEEYKKTQTSIFFFLVLCRHPDKTALATVLDKNYKMTAEEELKRREREHFDFDE
ncbi:hypothetical protein M513_13636, partial [Trichuris suis]